jgi:hypothetical protein
MRPALWRLLKRPSTVSILDSLVAAPIGIEQLGPNYTCARCYAYGIQQRAAARSEPLAKELPARRGQAPGRRPSRFRVYDIDASNDPSDAPESLPTNDHPPESLSLQPERLEFESDIGHTDEIGTRLVDDPARRHDFLLWGELLRYRQRHYGDEGTLDIFNALTRRVDRVYLPVEGELADFFWRSFIDLGLKREHILDRLASYAFKEWKEEGKRWGKFYECVVAGLFQRSQPHHAIKWHSRLQNPHLPRDSDIVRILEPALSAPTNRLPFLTKGMRRLLSPGIMAFQKICLSTRGSGLYRPVISTLLQLGYAEDALSMHEFLVKERQHAPSYQDVYPLLDYANKYELWEDFLSLKGYANKRFPAEEPADEAETTDEKRPGTGAGTLLKTTSVKEKPLKDELGARLFATTALGLDTVLSGMEMFGVQAIGPLSLREMGVRSHGSGDIQEKLQKLQKARISIGDSVYARLFRKLATENRDILLSDLLKSDQHPDVLEDANTQEQMLATNYMARDSRQYNLTLAILGELLPDGAELSNVHFRKYIVSGELDLASKLVDEMALNSEGLSKQSVDFMVKRVLNVRSPAKNPTDRQHGRLPDGVGFVVRILQRTAAAGQYMPPEIWIEMLKRLGMTNRFDELRSCCLWLARFYTSRAKHSSRWARSPFPDKPESAHTTLSPDAAERMRQSVFNKHMQGAMVSWGFKMRISGHYQRKAYNPFEVYGEGLVPWTRGLVLLRELEKEGVHLYVERIQKSCQQRLAMVFGPSIQSIRRMNRLLRRENPYSAKTTLGDIGRVWGEPLFGDRELDDIRELMKPPRATVKQLWRRRRRNQGTDGGRSIE